MKAKTIVRCGVAWGAMAVVWGGAAEAGPPKPASSDEITQMIAAAGDAKAYPGAQVVQVLDEADVYVEKSGLATTESCQVLKILTDQGVRDNSVYRLEFDPATNRITICSIRVHRKGGAVDDLDVSKVITQPARQNAIFWGNQQYVLSVPSLEIGDAVEVRLSRVGYNIAYLAESDAEAGAPVLSATGEPLRPPMPGHWFEVTEFQAHHPIIKKRYSVHMPKDMPVQYEVYNGPLKSSLWFDGDRHIHTWTLEDSPAFKSEPHMVASSDCTPKVVLATVPDWQSKSRWFYEANEGQFEADESIRAKVHELTDGLVDEEAKLAALNGWVADNCRYFGTSRGQHEGFTLHKSIETFHDRGGVCKDKAGMLVTMLRVLGYEAYAALTMAGSRVEDIPADQFNHTVTVMRNKDGSFRILDPTWAPLSRELWSSREALQGLVYGTPEGQSLTLSPYFEPEYNRLISRSEGEITQDGTLSTRISMEMHGYPCTYLRRTVARYPQAEQRSVFEEALHVAPNARLEELKCTDPYDYSQDSRVDLTLAAGDYAAGQGGVRLLRLPLLAHPLSDFLFPDALYAVDAEKREYAMRLRATRLVQYEEKLKLPAGWKVVRMPDPVTLDCPAASLSFEATSGDPGAPGLSYQFKLVLKTHIVQPKDYAEFRKTLQAMKKLSEEWIVCSVERVEPTQAAAKDVSTR